MPINDPDDEAKVVKTLARGGDANDVMKKGSDEPDDWVVGAQTGGGGGGDVTGPNGGVVAGEVTQFADGTGKEIAGSGVQASDIVRESELVESSAGAADAGKAVKLDSSGQFDSSVIPAGGGSGDVTGPAGGTQTNEIVIYADSSGKVLAVSGVLLDELAKTADVVIKAPATSLTNLIQPTTGNSTAFSVLGGQDQAVPLVRIGQGPGTTSANLFEIVNQAIENLFSVDRMGDVAIAGSADVAANITVGGTVDGRDVANDGAKLDLIEDEAKDDQAASEVPHDPIAGLLTDNVQAALEDIQSSKAETTDLDAHVNAPSPHSGHAVGPGPGTTPQHLAQFADGDGQTLESLGSLATTAPTPLAVPIALSNGKLRQGWIPNQDTEAPGIPRLTQGPRFAVIEPPADSQTAPGVDKIPLGDATAPGSAGTFASAWVSHPQTKEATGAADGSLDEWLTRVPGTGVYEGLQFTDLGGGVLRVAPGRVLIRAADDPLSPPLFADVAQEDITVPADGETYFVNVVYTVAQGTSVKAEATYQPTQRSSVFLGTVLRGATATDLVTSWGPVQADSIISRINAWVLRGFGVKIPNDSQLPVVGTNTSRHVTTTAATAFFGLNELAISATDTGAGDDFDRLIWNGTSFDVESGQTQWDNTRYQNPGGGTSNLQNNRYSQRYFFLIPSSTGAPTVWTLLGEANENQLANVPIEPPTNLPVDLAASSLYLGMAIIQQGGNSFVPFYAPTGDGGGVSVEDHQGLSNREVINAHERYELGADLSTPDNRRAAEIWAEHIQDANNPSTDPHEKYTIKTPNTTVRNTIIPGVPSAAAQTLAGSSGQSVPVWTCASTVTSPARLAEVTHDFRFRLSQIRLDQTYEKHDFHCWATNAATGNKPVRFTSYDSNDFPFVVEHDGFVRQVAYAIKLTANAGNWRVRTWLNGTQNWNGSNNAFVVDQWAWYIVDADFAVVEGDEIRLDIAKEGASPASSFQAVGWMELEKT